MIRYALSLFLLVLLSLAAQQFIPALTGLYNARLLLVTLVFLCASVTVGPPVMLALAFVSLVALGILGFATDRMFRWGIYTFAGRYSPTGG